MSEANGNGAARRTRIGVVIPSTNTSVESDYNDLRPANVSFDRANFHQHADRVRRQGTADPAADPDGSEKAVHDVCTCQPDHLIMGMSSETSVGGLKGSRELTERMEKMSGLRVSTGSEATNLALESIGAKRIAVVTPYQPSIDAQVERYFDDLGYEMVAMKSLRCPNAVAIADVTGEEILGAIAELEQMAAQNFDAFVQAGTNLSSWRVAEEVERRTGKPLLAINAATVWHALGELGLDARLPAPAACSRRGARDGRAAGRSRLGSSRCSRRTRSVTAICCSSPGACRWTPRAARRRRRPRGADAEGDGEPGAGAHRGRDGLRHVLKTTVYMIDIAQRRIPDGRVRRDTAASVHRRARSSRSRRSPSPASTSRPGHRRHPGA